MNRVGGFLLILSGALMLSAPSLAATDSSREPKESESRVLALVNGEEILADDVERRLSRVHGGAEEGQRSTFDFDSLLFKIVNDVLLGQEARALEMDKDEATASKVDDYRRELARKYLEKVEVEEYSGPTVAEVRETFEDQYRRVTFRVLTGYEKADADRMLADLRGGADLARLAAESSVDPYRIRGGLVDDIARVDLQREVGELVFSLEPGGFGGPVRTDLGWSVVRVDSFSAANEDLFEGLRRSLEALVRQRKAKARREELALQLQDRHLVKVSEEVVASLTPTHLPDGRLTPTISDPKAIVASVGESEVITASEYGGALLGRWKRVRNLEAARAAAPIILRLLIQERLLIAEARARGYFELPLVERAVYAYETQILIPPFLEDVVAAGITVSEDEKRAFYEEHKNEFNRPPRVRLGQITVGSLEEAERMMSLLRKGGNLSWLAQQHSLDQFKEQGGDRGWMSPQPGTDDFQAAMFEAQVGEVLEPIAGLDSYTVMKVTDRREQGVFEFDEISGNIREKVFASKFRQALDQFVSTLRSRSEIDIDKELLASLSVSATVEEEHSEEEGGGDHHG